MFINICPLFRPTEKKMKKSMTYAILLTIAVLATPASAKYITLTNTVTIERVIAGDSTTVNVSLVNTGDEAAYDVQLSLLTPDGITSTQMNLGKVDPSMPQKGTFDVNLSNGIAPGKYSVAILTEYKDANGYPFSSVTPNYLVLKDSRSSQMAGTIQEISLGNKETQTITLDMRNMDSKDHAITIRLYAPKELKIDAEEKTMTISARSEAKSDYSISSFGALPGSSYVVFASLDYDDGGVHYSSTASGIVKVVEQKDFLNFSGLLPIAALAVIVLAFIIYQFKK